MTHVIGRIRRRVRRAGPSGGRGISGAVRRAVQAGNIQAKLKVGAQNDTFEREADSVASHVMAGHAVETVSSLAAGQSQRKCDECEAEDAQRTPLVQRQEAEQEEEEVQMKRRTDIQRQAAEEEEEMLQAKRLQSDVQRQEAEEEEEALQAKAAPDGLQRQAEEEEEEVQTKAKSDGSFTASTSVSAQVSNLKGGGNPLSSSARAYFEPRFGADFSDVRVHTGKPAATAARALNARAFTTGRDVVFGKGEYAPHSRQGGELLAHELTHVIQQRGYKNKPDGKRGAPSVQRWQIGTAPVPAGPNWTLVPQGTPKGTKDHRKKLNDARAIVEGVMKNKRCAKYFTDKCENASASSLKDAFGKTRLYFMDVGDTLFGWNILGTGNVAYNRTTFNQSKWFLASTILHEMYHVCAPTSPVADREWNAENAAETCRLYTPFLDRISPANGAVGSDVTLEGWNFGPTRGKSDRVELNGVSCPIQSWTFDRLASKVTIVVTIPKGAKTGSLRVINNNVKSRPAKYTVT